MNTETNFCLRVDVDTFEGITKGLPKVSTLIKKFEIPITVYLSLGKYATGRNLFRKINKKEKIGLKIPPWERNSIKSLFRGILLPVKRIGNNEKNYLEKLENDNLIEIHPHGYNHVSWSKNFQSFSYEKTRIFIEKFSSEYKYIFNKKPIANAAPNFNTNKHYFQILMNNEFIFSSDFIYKEPFILKINHSDRGIKQLPVTEPTIEELILSGKDKSKILSIFKSKFNDYCDRETKYICFYLHSIYEPIKLPELIENICNIVIKNDMKATTHSSFVRNCSDLQEINLTKFEYR